MYIATLFPAPISRDARRYNAQAALALGGWVALKPIGDEAMMMGDLVLLESEINPVMAKMIR